MKYKHKIFHEWIAVKSDKTYGLKQYDKDGNLVSACMEIPFELVELGSDWELIPEAKYEVGDWMKINWIDIIILGLDGFWRAGGNPEDIMKKLIKKQNINFKRKYLKVAEDKPSFHRKKARLKV